MSEEDEKDRDWRERRRRNMVKGRRELERGLSDQSQRMSSYKKYYKENKGKLIDSIIFNYKSNKGPAVTGIIVLLPMLVTIYVADWILEKISSLPMADLLNLTQYSLVNSAIKIVFIIGVGAFLAMSVGRFVRTKSGFKVEQLVDRGIERIPFLGFVYSVTKVTADTFLNGAEEFSDPVKLDFNGIRVTAYRTGNTAEDGRSILFLPTSPNITTGFVVEVREGQIVQTNDTAREALTRTLSAGFGSSVNRENRRQPLKDPEKEDSK